MKLLKLFRLICMIIFFGGLLFLALDNRSPSTPLTPEQIQGLRWVIPVSVLTVIIGSWIAVKAITNPPKCRREYIPEAYSEVEDDDQQPTSCKSTGLSAPDEIIDCELSGERYNVKQLGSGK